MWFAKYASYYAAHGSDADYRKGADSNEGARHFIDIDYYPEFHSSWFPRDLDWLISKYGASVVYHNGVLPWAIKWDYDSLVTFLKDRDTVNANRVIADLGHYIGDAHQPLHCTETYNRHGVHSRYETDMLEGYLGQISIFPDTAHYISDVLDFAFKVIYISNSKFQMIDDADDSATTTAGSTSSSLYYQIMWSKLGAMTIAQLQDASVSLASLVYSASIDAGILTSYRTPQSVPNTFSISQPYPNPFNPSTSIEVMVKSFSAEAYVHVYSVTGSLMRHEIVNLHQGGNKVALNFAGLPSGVYFVRITLPAEGIEKSRTLKALFLK